MITDTDNPFNVFKFDAEEIALLFALQKLVIEECINISTNPTDKMIKKDWLKDWIDSIQEAPFISNAFEFNSEILLEKINSINPIEKRKIIILEAVIFIPFFRIKKRHDGISKLKELYKENKNAQDRMYPVIANFITKLPSITQDEIASARQSYNTAISEIPPKKYATKAAIVAVAAVVFGFTGGVLAPVLGTMVGSLLGLSGAAATSAGLAFLGGGALASGGLGMAGGTFFVIGGGSILGSVLGFSVTEQLFKDSNYVLAQLARIETIIKVFYQSNTEIIVKTIQALKEITNNLNDESKKSKELIDSEINRLKDLI